jgi:HSP20 family protein
MLPAKPTRQGELFWPRVGRAWDLLDRPFDRLFDDLLGRFAGPSVDACNLDVWEDPNHLYIEAEMPGLTEKDVEVTVENGVLTIRGQQEADKQTTDRDYYLRERRSARFVRSVQLPTLVNENKVAATLKDGILTIKLDKREEVKPRKIDVKAG